MADSGLVQIDLPELEPVTARLGPGRRQPAVVRTRSARKGGAERVELAELRARVETLQRALGARTKEVIELRCERALRDYEQANCTCGKQAPATEVERPFGELVDEAVARGDARGSRLAPSVDLQEVPFVHYRLPSATAGLCGVRLAVTVDRPHSSGTVGIEIVSADRILVHATIPLSGVQDGVPTGFAFAPLRDVEPGSVWLRVFARAAEPPVRLLEWRRRILLGLGPERRLALAGLAFVPSAVGAEGDAR